jgi:hypothetical protein
MTRASALVVVLASLALGCGSSPSTSPTAPAATNPTFSASLLASSETPPIANGESGVSGSATITFVTTKDTTGAISSATATVVASMSGFPAGSSITLAHIHTGAVGVAGPVLVPLIPAAGSVTLTNGSGTFTQSQAVDGPTATSIINNPAGFYFNVHTALNPGGVMRGQLVRTN